MFASIIVLPAILAILYLTGALLLKMEKTKQLQAETEKLKKSLHEMDEQAKLIIRTDMELNKTQEELDKKISGLYALQRLSRNLSTTLEEKLIFNTIDTSYIEDLGFEKACAFLWSDEEKHFSLSLNIGYPPQEIKNISEHVENNKESYLGLISRKMTISSLGLEDNPELKNKICRVFGVISFIASPVLPKEGDTGILFVGTANEDTLITEGDEELINILTNQLGQAIENARLFEQTWRAQQGLERKVEERTHELSMALQEVKKASQRKTDFVSSVSHELRTPLTSIKGYASILLTGQLGALPTEAKQRIEKMNRHSDELAQLVNELLDISRIESGKIAMKQETHNLNNIATKVLDLLSVQLKEKQISTTINIAKDATLIFIDLAQIERVFINIIGNALKFTPPKGKIAIAAHKTDKTIQVDISDNGCGIPAESQETIFEEFYRVDNTINQEVKGTGLGLSLVKRIIEAHKGKIWVNSKTDYGATFSFSLPQAN